MRFESGGNGSAAAKCVPLLYYGQENFKGFQATYASGMSFSVKDSSLPEV